MGDNTKLHQDMLSFLMTEWQRKDQRQLVAVDLVYTPLNGFRDEQIRNWVRADEPEIFTDFGTLEKLVLQIIEIAEGEAEAKPPGKHRFVVRCSQHAGSRPQLAFFLSPTFHGNADDALVPMGGGGGGSRDQQVIASHASRLMGINAQMFEGTIRVLSQQNSNLHQQVTDLTAENSVLRRELEDARSNKMDREYQWAMVHEKNNRSNAMFKQFMQLGTVVAAKIGAGKDGGQSQDPNSSPLALMLGEFYSSIRPEQMNALMQTLDMAQKIMFLEISKLVKPPDEDGPEGPQAGPPGANGMPAL